MAFQSFDFERTRWTSFQKRVMRTKIRGILHVLCCVFVLFFVILCSLCSQFLWNIHFWFPLRYSLTFIKEPCELSTRFSEDINNLLRIILSLTYNWRLDVSSYYFLFMSSYSPDAVYSIRFKWWIKPSAAFFYSTDIMHMTTFLSRRINREMRNIVFL